MYNVCMNLMNISPFRHQFNQHTQWNYQDKLYTCTCTYNVHEHVHVCVQVH